MKHLKKKEMKSLDIQAFKTNISACRYFKGASLFHNNFKTSKEACVYMLCTYTVILLPDNVLQHNRNYLFFIY